MLNDYTSAWDALSSAIGAAQGQPSGSINELDHLTVDQQLRVAEIAALLSVAQELAALNPRSTAAPEADGISRDQWGFPRLP